MIPFLHIPFNDSPAITFVRQYISRLGVPCFFAISGFFLKQAMNDRGRVPALLHYEKRVGRLLITWLVIYSPILIASSSNMLKFVQEVLFLTPAFLWYLTALLVAAIPFCLIKNRKALWLISIVLYLFGTLLGENYSWLTGGAPRLYTTIFLTTRNGVFFALPLMCAGEASYSEIHYTKKSGSLLLVATSLALFAEITYVGRHVYAGADRSMYLLLPLFSYYLIQVAKQVQVPCNTTVIRKATVAIYVMQFGIIYIFKKIYNYTGLTLDLYGAITWIFILLIGLVAAYFAKRNRWLVYLF